MVRRPALTTLEAFKLWIINRLTGDEVPKGVIIISLRATGMGAVGTLGGATKNGIQLVYIEVPRLVHELESNGTKIFGVRADDL